MLTLKTIENSNDLGLTHRKLKVREIVLDVSHVTVLSIMSEHLVRESYRKVGAIIEEMFVVALPQSLGDFAPFNNRERNMNFYWRN